MLSKIAVNYIWMPVTSVDVERSFSEYKHLLNDRRERLTEENTRRLMILYYNGDIEHQFRNIYKHNHYTKFFSNVIYIKTDNYFVTTPKQSYW